MHVNQIRDGVFENSFFIKQGYSYDCKQLYFFAFFMFTDRAGTAVVALNFRTINLIEIGRTKIAAFKERKCALASRSDHACTHQAA